MKPIKIVRIAICLLTFVALNTGCQSGLLKKPDFGRLAFWKNDNLRLAAKTDDIPPPSVHFSPDPGSEGSGSKEAMKDNIDQIIANAKKTDNKVEPKMAEAKMATSKSSDPIRKPYSLNSINPKIAQRKIENQANDFVLGDVGKSFQSQANKSLNAASNQFSAAANNTVKAATNSVTSLSNSFAAGAKEAKAAASNTFSGWKNTLKQQPANSLKQAAAQLSAQTDQIAAATSKQANQSAESISQTIASAMNSFQPGSGGQVVKNPFPSGISKTIASNTKDFASKYKVAAKEKVKSAGTAKINKSFDKKLLTPDPTIQQSSFNADIDKNKATILQPDFGSSSKQGATAYPSTGFKAFTAVKRDAESATEAMKIPASLLRGDSSFAPGSTRPLRSTGK